MRRWFLLFLCPSPTPRGAFSSIEGSAVLADVLCRGRVRNAVEGDEWTQESRIFPCNISALPRRLPIAVHIEWVAGGHAMFYRCNNPANLQQPHPWPANNPVGELSSMFRAGAGQPRSVMNSRRHAECDDYRCNEMPGFAVFSGFLSIFAMKPDGVELMGARDSRRAGKAVTME
jgi:hypothetical protein